MVHRMAGIPKRYLANPQDVANDNDPVSIHVRKLWRRMKPLILKGVPQGPCPRDWPVKLQPWEWEKRYTLAQAQKLRTQWLCESKSTAYSVFVKKEKVLLSSIDFSDNMDPSSWGLLPEGIVSDEVMGDPRGISVPPPARRYECGPEADFYNRRLMRLFNGRIFYACGSKPENLGWWVDWIMDNYRWGVAVMGDDVLVVFMKKRVWYANSLDISRYDQHIRLAHLQIGWDVMKAFGCRLLRYWMKVMCLPRNYIIHHPLIDGFLRFLGTRASGDPDTISSNSLVVIVIAWDACRRGADLKQAFWEAGFVVTGGMEEFHSGKWDFLQKIFYPAKTTGGHTFHPAPKLGRFAARAFWSSEGYALWKMPGYCRGVALSLEKDFNHVPVARALVARVLYLTRGHTAFVDKDTARSMEYGLYSTTRSELDPAVYLLFEQRYGVSKEECDAVESEISGLEWDEFIDSPRSRSFWERVLRVDM